MNTAHIRKVAISKCLAELMEDSCKFSPDTPARWGVIEPNIPALMQFIDMTGRLVKLHFQNKLTIGDVEDVIEFCKDIARPIGHLMSDGCTTGTWGVRLSDLDNIIEILEIPDFDLLPLKSPYITYGITCKIKEYHSIDTNWIVVRFTPDDNEMQEFEDCVYWKNIHLFDSESK